MAETKKTKKNEKNEIVLERIYNVPLRKEWLKTQKYRRAKKAVNALQQFISKHMKSDDVKIGTHANLEIWKHGIKNPPHHINVKATKYADGSVMAELEGVKLKERVPNILRKARAKLEKKPKKKIEMVSEKKEEKPEEAKIVEKEGIKELKEELKSKPKAQHAPKSLVKDSKVEARPNAPQSQ
jgi:large subunit ribosomal protein L31e